MSLCSITAADGFRAAVRTQVPGGFCPRPCDRPRPLPLTEQRPPPESWRSLGTLEDRDVTGIPCFVAIRYGIVRTLL